MEEKPVIAKKTNLKIILIFALIGIAAIAIIISARGSLRPIFIGCALAVLMKSMCNLFYRRMEHHASKRAQVTDRLRKWLHVLSILFTYVTWFIIISAFALLVVPRFGVALSSMVKSIPGFVSATVLRLEAFINEHPMLSDYSEMIIETAISRLGEWASTDLTKVLGNIANIMINGISGTVGLLFDTVVGVIISLYLIAGRKKLAAQLKLVLYAMLGQKHARVVIDELKFADKMLSSYFTGSLLDSLLVGLICYVGTLIFGIPYGVLVAVIVGVTNIIPFFGPYIGLIPSAIIILTQSPMHAVVFVIMMVVLQQIDGNIICPRIVGNTTGLSSFWVLFAILLFGGLFGFIGMLIGVPVFAVIYDIIEKIVRYSLRLRGETAAEQAYDLAYPAGQPRPKRKSGTQLARAMRSVILFFGDLKTKADLARKRKGVADGGEENADSSEESADGSEENADGGEENADSSEENADSSEENADGGEENADGSEENADISEENADGSEENANITKESAEGNACADTAIDDAAVDNDTKEEPKEKP